MAANMATEQHKELGMDNGRCLSPCEYHQGPYHYTQDGKRHLVQECVDCPNGDGVVNIVTAYRTGSCSFETAVAEDEESVTSVTTDKESDTEERVEGFKADDESLEEDKEEFAMGIVSPHFGDTLSARHLAIDVHNCVSATCQKCHKLNQDDNNSVQFISSRTTIKSRS